MSDLPKIQPIVLDGFKLNVDDYLTRAYDDVSAASAELPAVMEWLGHQLQIIREDTANVRIDLDQARAKAYIRLNTQEGWLDAGYAGKRTSDGAKMAVDLDEDVIKLERSHALLTAYSERLRGTIRNFQSKLELVRTAEATRRHTDEAAGARLDADDEEPRVDEA